MICISNISNSFFWNIYFNLNVPPISILKFIVSFFSCSRFSDCVQVYSFVLTTDDSKWRFGFCRHDPKTESTMVLITFLPWHDTFLRLLAVLAELRRTDPKEFHQFLTKVYSSGVPDVGRPVKLVYSQEQSVSFWKYTKIY